MTQQTHQGAQPQHQRLETAKAALAQAMVASKRSGSSLSPDVDPQYAQAKRIVLRKLAAAPRSRAQLAEALAAKQIPEAVADAVLARMEEVGLVDDEAFAEMVVRSASQGRGLARRSLAEELRKRGVSDEIAEQALSPVDDATERDAARRLVDKRLRTMGGLEIDVKRRRLAGMLARKGYSSGVVYPVVSEALAEAVEHRRD